MSKLQAWQSMLIAIGLACLVGVLFSTLFCAALAAGVVSAANSRPKLRVIEVEQPRKPAAGALLQQEPKLGNRRDARAGQ